MHSEASRLESKRQLAEAHASVLAGLTPGTILMTREGEAPVEWIEAGDEVLTRDRGFVPILWINRTKLTRADMRKYPEYAPVSLAADCIEPGCPAQDVMVSPRQLVLIRSHLAQRDYGSAEVLVPALCVGAQADPVAMPWDMRVSYAHVLLPTHQMLTTEGLWLGTLFTGALGMEADPTCPLIGQLESAQMQACRPVLNVEEGQALMQEIWAAQVAETAFYAEDTRDVG